MRIFMALLQTGFVTVQWSVVMWYAEMEREFPPEVLASAHFHRPFGLTAVAVFMTVSAASAWALAIFKAARDDRAGD